MSFLKTLKSCLFLFLIISTVFRFAYSMGASPANVSVSLPPLSGNFFPERIEKRIINIFSEVTQATDGKIHIIREGICTDFGRAALSKYLNNPLTTIEEIELRQSLIKDFTNISAQKFSEIKNEFELLKQKAFFIGMLSRQISQLEVDIDTLGKGGNALTDQQKIQLGMSIAFNVYWLLALYGKGSILLSAASVGGVPGLALGAGTSVLMGVLFNYITKKIITGGIPIRTWVGIESIVPGAKSAIASVSSVVPQPACFDFVLGCTAIDFYKYCKDFRAKETLLQDGYWNKTKRFVTDNEFVKTFRLLVSSGFRLNELKTMTQRLKKEAQKTFVEMDIQVNNLVERCPRLGNEIGYIKNPLEAFGIIDMFVGIASIIRDSRVENTYVEKCSVGFVDEFVVDADSKVTLEIDKAWRCADIKDGCSLMFLKSSNNKISDFKFSVGMMHEMHLTTPFDFYDVLTNLYLVHSFGMILGRSARSNVIDLRKVNIEYEIGGGAITSITFP